MTELDMLRSFGKRLKAARKHRGLTQVELANRTLTTRSAILRWENGTRQPQVLNVLVLAKELDVSVQWLLTGRKTKDECLA